MVNIALHTIAVNGTVGTMPMWSPKIEASSDEPFFRMIVQSLANDIARGHLLAEARLPTHRELAELLGVARGTVARAYAEAKRIGLLRCDVGRGTFVLAADADDRPYSTLLEPPVTFNDLSTNYPLTGIDPDPADALREIALRPDRMALMCYQSNLGMRRHRMAGVLWAERFGVSTNLDDLILCAGAQHALFVVLAHLTRPGDSILVEELSYPGLHGIAETLRIRLIAVEMDQGGLNPEGLERACRTHNPRALCCMPTAHNPTGVVLSATRRSKIARLARRHDLFIIEDDAYRLLVPNPPPPILTYAPERTFFIASTSKILGAGLRLAFLISPPETSHAVAKHVWATQWMVNPFGAEITAIWIDNGVADQALKQKRHEATLRQRLARRILAGHDIQGHPNVFHLWLKLPPRWRGDQIAQKAKLRNIGVTPASAFWMRATAPPGAIRIALGGINSRRELKGGLKTINEILSAAHLVGNEEG